MKIIMYKKVISKRLNIFSLLLFICYSNLFSQKIPSPKFDFSGIKTEWSYKMINNFKDDTVNLISLQEYNTQNLTHIIKGESALFAISNLESFNKRGCSLLNLDIRNGKPLWLNHYNYISDNSISGYSYFWDFNINNDTINLIGWAHKDTSIVIGGPKVNLNFLTKLNTNFKNGNTILKQTNFSLRDRETKAISNELLYNPLNNNKYYYAGIVRTNADTNVLIIPGTINDTLRSQRIEDSSKWIKLKVNDISNYKLYGPFKIEENKFSYILYAYSFSEIRAYNYIWSVDEELNFSQLKDISSEISGLDLNSGPLDIKYISSKKLIRVKVRSYISKEFPQGHLGYIYLDEYGNLVKDQRNLILDGMRVGHIESVDYGDELVHVIRFLENNDIHFYRENKNGEIKKIGSMINNNSKIYAFLPNKVNLTEKGDLIISFNVAIDSLIDQLSMKFDFGGWLFITRINGSELGITNVADIVNKKTFLSVMPNPIVNLVRIEGLNVNNQYSYNISNINGINFDQGIILGGNPEIKVELNSGMYFLNITDLKNGNKSSIKFVKS